MFILFIQLIINRLITDKYVIINKSGYAQRQLFMRNEKKVIIKTIPNLIFKEIDKNMIYIVPIREKVYYIKLAGNKYMFLNRHNDSVRARKLKFKTGTLNYDDAFEWKIHETNEGLKFESLEKCLQVFSHNNNDDIFFLRGVKCSDNKDQLFEMVIANILEENIKFLVNGVEPKKEIKNQKEDQTLNLIINGI